MTISSYYPWAKVNLSHVARSGPPLKKILKSFLSFLGGFFYLSLSDSSIAKAVPDLSSRCRGVKFIPFTIDSRGGAFILLGQQGALKLSVKIDAYVGFPKIVSCQAAVRSICPWNCFSKQQKLSCDIRCFSNIQHNAAATLTCTQYIQRQLIGHLFAPIQGFDKQGYPTHLSFKWTINTLCLLTALFHECHYHFWFSQMRSAACNGNGSPP